jgi:NitT/TauT family transport system substrate-binding protein
MRTIYAVAAVVAIAVLAVAAVAPAQDLPKVTVAMSGWTGFAPLALAEKTGIFKKHGADVTIKFIPQKDRHLAIASGDVQCAATTVETWIIWNANGVARDELENFFRRGEERGMFYCGTCLAMQLTRLGARKS